MPDRVRWVMRKAFVFILLIWTAIPVAAQARTRVDLNGLAQSVDGAVVVDTVGFQALVLDLGNILGVHSAGPAASTGALGLDVELDLAFSPLGSEHGHWEAVGNPRIDSLETLHLSARKGLPLGFQLGVHVSHLLDSHVWGVGAHLKYAILEGLEMFPDVGIRAGLSSVMGVRAMSFFAVETDVTVSKRFGFFGVAAVTPYAGYSLQFVQASSNVLGIFVQDDELAKFVIPRQQELQHRGIAGLQFWMTHVTVGFEAMISPELQSYTVKLGANL